MVRARLAMALSFAAIFIGADLHAQTPSLRPIANYLPAVDSGDVSALRYVARRCTALFILINNNLKERGDTATAARFESAGISFLTLAQKAEQAMGGSASAASVTTQSAIEDIAQLLMSRMKANMAASGSYYAEDELLRSDVTACAKLSKTGT